MVASIGAIASPSQGVSYYERDGYYAKDDPDHRAASAWAGKGADALGLSGPVEPDVFTAILEGRVAGRPTSGPPRQGRRNRPPSRPRPDPVRAEIRLSGRAGRRRCPRGRGSRARGGTDSRLGRGTGDRDPDEASRRRADDPRRGSEGGDRHLQLTRPRAISTPNSTPTR